MEKNLDDSAGITDAPTLFAESVYLITSNRRRCAELLKKNPPSEGDIVDIYVSIHIILEAGLNSLFRHISLPQIKKRVSEMKVIRYLDRISFIDKATLFIYNSSFDFGDDLDKATEYHKIIGELIRFSEVRDKLLHGHSISTISTLGRGWERQQRSETKKLMNEKRLDEQLKLFRHIMEGLRFYVNHLTTLDKASKKLVDFFLMDDFLPERVREQKSLRASNWSDSRKPNVGGDWDCGGSQINEQPLC